jgi:hypothetical protein
MFQEASSEQAAKAADSSSSSTGTAAAPKPLEQSRAAAKTPAAAPVRAAGLDVALVRVDNAGNMYTKT